MSFLNCSQQDCCHNKGGECCLGCVKVHHAGEQDAVCRSYRCSEGVGNVATDNAPATAVTDVRCDDAGCRYLKGTCCCADHVSIEEEGCGPRCRSRVAK
ncbi:MAG TPA: hypothetical protein H9945_04940 [Candidatus Gemmiger avicola]|uniref:DUF1540 domain-containing protein n=1 Tax=Candidatus Gemmiger avicola TaxID=2838605 RepID=A0A9D2S3E6_9FIRM|nr:hypothetical protein [Candidatus Gemmiger avicola]